MLVILEGPDGSGKSTLAAQLGGEVIHHGPYLGEEKIYRHYIESLLVAARTKDRTIIFDRSWLSEPIYGNIIRGSDRLGVQSRLLDRIALGLGAVCVLCLPPRDTVLSTVAKRHEGEYPKLHQVEDIYEGYAIGLDTAIPVVRYDYTRQKVVTLGYKIKGAQWQNLGPGIGAWRPGKSILFIAEQCGEDEDNVYGGMEWTLAGDRGCSPWFAGQLEANGVTEDQTYFVNALDRGGAELELDFIPRLHPKLIITLGKVADGLLTRHRIAHAAVEHPQYWKRFHHSETWWALKHALKGEV